MPQTNLFRRVFCSMGHFALIGLCAGCASTRSHAESSRVTIIDFKTPRIFMHVYENPASIEKLLTSDGPVIQTRRELGNANGDIVVTGEGLVRYGGRKIMVGDNSIVIDGTAVKSFPGRYRNVTIAPNGDITTDTFSPFESPRGYHPAK